VAPLPFFGQNGMNTPGFSGDGIEGAVLQNVLEIPLRLAARGNKPAHSANLPKNQKAAAFFAVHMPEKAAKYRERGTGTPGFFAERNELLRFVSCFVATLRPAATANKSAHSANL
jgi:hypothetical protein